MGKNIATLFLSMIGFSAVFAARKSQAPYIGYVYPAGARRGTTVTVVVGGMNFRGLKKGVVSGKGVEVLDAKMFKPFKRLRNDARRELMPILRAYDQGRDPIDAARKIAVKIQKRIKRRMEREAKTAVAGSKSSTPVVARKKSNPNKKRADMNYEEMLKIIPGERLIHIDITPRALIEKVKAMSKEEYQCLLKMVFTKKNVLQTAPAIAQTALVRIKVAPNAAPGFRELRLIGKLGISNPLRFEVGALPETSSPVFIIDGKEPPRKLQIGSVANGRIMPGEVDKYRFKAKKGAEIAFELEGRALVPFLSDAVPGWFQPIISIHDLKGSELAFADDDLFDPDPVLSFKVPYDGGFEIRVRDSIYRGREDFVYRLKSFFGKAPEKRFKKLRFRAELPRVDESEPNDDMKSATEISIGTLVSGTIHKPGDVDCFAFVGKKGARIAAEVFARRLDSPMDSVVKLLDSNGKTIAWNDDQKRPFIGLKTHFADSHLIAELPADGRYYLKVYDAQAKGGPLFRYVLRCDKPRPDFRVYTLPSAINARTRIANPIEVRVWRLDGFDGQIKLGLKKAPKGAKLAGAEIPAGYDGTRLTITLPGKLKKGLYDLVLSGEVVIDGRTVSRAAVPADDIMQAFLYRSVVPAVRGVLCVCRPGWLPVGPPKLKSVSLAPGGTSDIRLFDYRHGKKSRDKLFFELMSPPKELSLLKTTYDDNHYVLHLKAGAKMKPWKGNLIIQMIGEGTNKKNGKKYSYYIGALPAIPIEVGRSR